MPLLSTTVQELFAAHVPALQYWCFIVLSVMCVLSCGTSSCHINAGAVYWSAAAAAVPAVAAVLTAIPHKTLLWKMRRQVIWCHGGQRPFTGLQLLSSLQYLTGFPLENVSANLVAS